MNSSRTQSELCTPTPISSFVQCQVLFRLLPSSVATFVWIEIFLRQSHEYSGINNTYGIHHWRILRSNCRKLAWVGFEATITKFRSDALTDWDISSTRIQSQLCTATPISNIYMYIYIYIYIFPRSPRVSRVWKSIVQFGRGWGFRTSKNKNIHD